MSETRRKVRKQARVQRTTILGLLQCSISCLLRQEGSTESVYIYDEAQHQ